MKEIKEINAKNFIEAWRRFAAEHQPILLKTIRNTKEMTPKVVGKSIRSSKDSPLGDFLHDFFDESIIYRTEEYKIDLVFAKPDNFSRTDIITDINNESSGFYPVNYEILIEHEYRRSKCWEEMTKLTYYKARLKVLITYLNAKTGDNDPDSQTRDALVKDFSNIIASSNKYLPENPQTEYVFILGQRIIDSGIEQLEWYKFISCFGDFWQFKRV